jgi:hypothetical protein
VRELHLRVVELVHTEGGSDHYVEGGVPVAMRCEWRKFRLRAEVRSPR